MTRHRRLQKTLRSPLRAPKARRNRLSRQVYGELYRHYAGSHAHDGHGCRYDPARTP